MILNFLPPQKPFIRFSSMVTLLVSLVAPTLTSRLLERDSLAAASLEDEENTSASCSAYSASSEAKD